MEEKKKQTLLITTGTLFIIIGILSISNALYTHNHSQTLYLCYIGITITGIGIVTKKSSLIISQLYILLIPQIVWATDFIYQATTKQPLWGITDYYFTTTHFTLGNFISLQHLYVIPISIYSVYLIGKGWKGKWIISISQIIILYELVRIFSNPAYNVNCVYQSCIPLTITSIPYSLAWFGTYTFMIGITHTFFILLHRIVFEKRRGKNILFN